MNKLQIKKDYLSAWFDKRKLAALEEYRESIENSRYAKHCVMYRGEMFNPLDLKPRDIKGIYEVPENSEHGIKLDRFIRISKDIVEATSTLTYVLNYVDTEADFRYVALGEGKPTSKEKMDKFKEEISDKLSYLRRIRLLADMV